MAGRESIRFGDFELNASSLELRHGRRITKLERIPLRVLLMLIEEPGNVVTREEIAETIWGKNVFVDVDNGINCAIRKIRQVLRDDPQKPQFVQTIPGVGYRFLATPKTAHSAVRSPASIESLTGDDLAIPSLAVLPLNDHSTAADHEYFADSMTEALIANLAKIKALRIISRTSAMQYRGAHKSLPQIAGELNVDAVIEGSIVRDGKRVRIAVQLINAVTDQHIWAESYERDFRDILALQGEIARQIAEKVRIILTPEDRAKLLRVSRVNPEVHELYLKARYFWNKRTEEGIRRALDHYRRAIDVDPLYAKGYAGLSDCYNLLGYYNALAPTDAYPRARAAALKALEIDEGLAEAHAALGVVKRDFEWDWAGAESEFRRAIELNPGYLEAYHWHSTLSCMLGKYTESIQEKKRALSMDPLSVVVRADVARMLYYSRDYDHALVHYQATLEIDPEFAPARIGLALVHQRQGLIDTAILELEACLGRSPDNIFALARLGHAYALAARVNETSTILEKINALSAGRYISAFDVALIYVGLRDWNEAFAQLEAAYRERSIWLGYLGIDPQFDELRTDQRFHQLLSKVGLPI